VRVARLKLRGFQQFQHLDLDLTDPTTSEPLERVCFIGRNGTGKSTLLREIEFAVTNTFQGRSHDLEVLATPLIAAEVRSGGRSVWRLAGPGESNFSVWLTGQAESHPSWERLFEGGQSCHASDFNEHKFKLPVTPFEAGKDLVIQAPPDRALELQNDPPSATLNDALALVDKLPLRHVLSPDNANAFWRLLIALHTRRNRSRDQYFEEHRDQVYATIQKQFDDAYPQVLSELEKLWDRLLAPAGLEFDLSSVKWPEQLDQSLAAHVRVKETRKAVRYNALSSGIRNFLFRLGHLFALYFQRDVRHGFLFVDEPENSLHPDFLYDLMDRYTEIIAGKNTQFFVATHSPIVAAQFRPEERVLLDFDDNAHVVASRGHAAQGDDPNDVLLEDFGVNSVYGSEGLKNWDRFIELKQLMKHESDQEKLKAYRDEYLQIGHRYHFDSNEVPVEAE
jgi:predicted ATPase